MVHFYEYPMKTALPGRVAGNSSSLQGLLNELVNDLSLPVYNNRIVVENEVSAELLMQADKSVVLPVIHDLLATVVSNARNTCISISAEKYRDVLTLHVEDRNNYNGYALSFGLLSVGRHARYIGGDICVKDVQKKVARVSLSFPDTPGRKVYPFEAYA